MGFATGCEPELCKMAHDHDEYNIRAVEDNNRERFNPTRCLGVGKTADIPAKWANISPYFKGSCPECLQEVRLNPKSGATTEHPPGRMRFTFKLKFNGFCDVGYHSVLKGTMARYLGNRLACSGHM